MIMSLSIHALNGFCRMFLCMDHMAFPISIDLTTPSDRTLVSSAGNFSRMRFLCGTFSLMLCGQHCKTNSLVFAV